MKLTTPTADEQRKRELAKIHVLKKNLRLDDDCYRAIINQMAKVQSAKDLDQAGRRRLLDRLEELERQLHGGRPTPSPSGAATRPRSSSHPAGGQPQGRQVALIRALWGELAARGIIRHGTPEALNHFVRRVTGVERVDWLQDVRKANATIEALKNMGQREKEKQA